MNSIRIERAANGFVVCMNDPEIVKKNRKSTGAWRDPEQKFVFDDEAGVTAFLTKNLDKIIPDGKDDYSTSFDIAAAEDEPDEDDEE